MLNYPLGDGSLSLALVLAGFTIAFGTRHIDTTEHQDGMILATEWNEFREPDFNKMKSLMRRPLIFDGRNIFDPQRLREAGFTYYGIGIS